MQVGHYLIINSSSYLFSVVEFSWYSWRVVCSWVLSCVDVFYAYGNWDKGASTDTILLGIRVKQLSKEIMKFSRLMLLMEIRNILLWIEKFLSDHNITSRIVYIVRSTIMIHIVSNSVYNDWAGRLIRDRRLVCRLKICRSFTYGVRLNYFLSFLSGFMKCLRMSIGNGNMMVEFFSAEMVLSVWR